jgi:hypothetical protein
LDEWVVMPNHFHGVLVLTTTVGAIHESPLGESFLVELNLMNTIWKL